MSADIIAAIEHEGDDIRLKVGRRSYLLSISKRDFIMAFNQGLQFVHLHEVESGVESALSDVEMKEIKQEIVVEAIRFRIINKMPPMPQPQDSQFALYRVGIIVFEKAVEKFGRRCPEAYLLAARVLGRRIDEIEDVIANRDARYKIY